MIALWVLASPHDVESYAATLILPSYLAHLELVPVQFSSQAAHRDGREPLLLTYRGAGRWEEYPLEPAVHALGLLRFLCPQIEADRVQLPQNDASWYWPAPDGEQAMRVYFAPTAGVLGQTYDRPQSQEAYVSVSRRHVFVGPAVLRRYLQAWLTHLGLSAEALVLECGAVSGGIDFQAGRVCGQLFVDEQTAAEDLLRFAGLAPALAEVQSLVGLDFGQDCRRSGAQPDGVYLPLASV